MIEFISCFVLKYSDEVAEVMIFWSPCSSRNVPKINAITNVDVILGRPQFAFAKVDKLSWIASVRFLKN